MVNAHTLTFNIVAAKVPATIIEGFRAASEGTPRMDWNMLEVPVESRLSTDYRGEKHDLTGLELGPASGVCVQRHTVSRSSLFQFRRALIPSRRCHNEKVPPNCSYIMSYTTAYNHTGPDGDFYFAKYGIPVEQAASNLILHNATEFHGTLVHDIDWDPPGKAKDAKENKEVATKWETDPPELPEHRPLSLLIPDDLRETYRKGMQAQTAAPGGGPADSIGGPPVGEGRETEGAADARDEDRMEVDAQTTSAGGRRLFCSRNNQPRTATPISVSSASFKFLVLSTSIRLVMALLSTMSVAACDEAQHIPSHLSGYISVNSNF